MILVKIFLKMHCCLVWESVISAEEDNKLFNANKYVYLSLLVINSDY